MFSAWLWVASPAASVTAGLVSLAILIRRGRHRDTRGRAAHGSIAMAILQGAALYTFIVTVLGHWFLHIPVAASVQAGFGNERFAWLLLGISIDLLYRLYSLYDPGEGTIQ